MTVNKWIGIGNVTRDVELKYTPSGAAVVSFSIACNERYKDKDGQQQEKVEYVNIVAWRQLAEIIGKYVQKGQQIYVEGKLTTRSYDDRDGNKRYVTEVVADQMQMLGRKEGGERPQSADRRQGGQNPRQPAQGGGGYEPIDDGIPF